MQADYIKKIIRNMDDLPYKAILFNGAWGIGKSYAINEALKEKENVCKISMFGLSDAKEIYHEVLFQIVLKNKVGGKIGKIANSILEAMSTFWDKAAQAKKILHNIAKERELFLLLSKEFNSLHIIVIDDLERISDNVNLEEVLGIVEELKQCNYVKVILVAHLDEVKEKDKELLDRYSEKVIERIYNVTERPDDVNWGKLKIDSGFINEFLAIHKVKNLRTLEKAQNFFDDVKIFCSNITDEQFLNEIRLICFSIVVESIDNLYYKEENEREKDDCENIISKIRNEIDHRIRNYLITIKCSGNLVSMLLQYYKNEIVLNTEIISAEYKGFLQSGCKSNYYKTDEEIKALLPDLKANMDNAQNLIELNKFADEYMVWSDTIKCDNADVLQAYKERVHILLSSTVLEGKEEILSYGYDLFHLSSEKIKQIYEEENTNIKTYLIETYIGYLQETTKGKKAFDYSYKLRKYFDSNLYRDIIKQSVDWLYDRKSFPIDIVDENQYHTCFNIMYVLYHTDNDRFLKFSDEFVKSCDYMSAYRIEQLVKELVKGY